MKAQVLKTKKYSKVSVETGDQRSKTKGLRWEFRFLAQLSLWSSEQQQQQSDQSIFQAT